MKFKTVFKSRAVACILTAVFILFASPNTSVEVNALSNKANTIVEAINTTDKLTNKAEEAKKLLVAGNERFISGTPAKKDISEVKRKDLAVNGQKPFAVILSCSDSRVPPEIIFDQGLGDLFVVRNAGNVVDPVVLGSVEYGVKELNAPLIVVLGHESCGAVKAAVDGTEEFGSIDSITSKIKPLCEKLKPIGANKKYIYERCEDENIKNSVAELASSPVIKKLIAENKVSIVAAKYYLESGKVVFQ